MLGKLLKHESYATFRLFIPIVFIVIVITPISAAMLASTMGGNEASWASVLTTLMTILYVLIMVGFSFSPTIIILYRFYKGMVSDEAYLTHTLPVRTSHVIVSKLLIGLLLQIVNITLILASIVSFTKIVGLWNTNDFRTFWNILVEGFREINVNGTVFLIEFVLIVLVSATFGTLMMYASIAIGQLLKGHRILGAVCAYIGISFVVQVVMSVFSAIFATSAATAETMEPSFVHVTMLGSTAILAVFSIVFFFMTNYVFRKKLNLE